jgi:two-component system, sensor histidine kinase
MTQALREETARRVFEEQLRLPLRAVRATIPANFLLVGLIYLSLGNPANRGALGAWCVMVVLSKLNAYFHARRWLAAGVTADTAGRLLRGLKLIYALDGMAWGALAWITLDTCTPMGNLLALTAIAGIVLNRMSHLSPLLTVCTTFIIGCAAVWFPKVLFFSSADYFPVGIAAIFFAIAMLLQTRSSVRAMCESIELRFRNEELADRLRIETGIAEAARQEAEAANLAKSKFLAAASHDLRQPAHAQGLFLDILSRTQLNDRQRELLDNARAVAGASAEMLDTLLDFSRVEAGVFEPKLSDFPLQRLFHKIEREFGRQADAKDLVYRSRETGLTVRSDPAQVELIVRNLVANAIRYTQRGGLLVACRRRGEHAELEVWDTGVGIAPEQQKDVFREFLQLGNPERDRRKGLGLGLAIADGLAKRLGLQLTLASRPQQGSVFRLTLPIVAPTPDAANETDVRDDADVSSLAGIRILVIDDDDAVRNAMRHLLADWGCPCDAAETIEEALALARQNTPALVVSDYRLRGQQNGSAAIAALRAQLGDDLPALLITGDTAPDRLREALASGIPLLHKPVPPDELYRQLATLLAKSTARPSVSSAA